MKMAKASQADLEIAMELAGMLDTLGHRHCPSMPAVIARNDGDEDFDRDDDDQCGRALRVLLETADRGSLFRVVWGAAVMLDRATSWWTRMPAPLRRTRKQNPTCLSRQIIMMREHAAHYLTETGHGCMRVSGLRMPE